MGMLEALPEGHPSRATLTTHVEELIDTLVRREARQFEPLIPVGHRSASMPPSLW
jgi:hypothetical protein